MKIKHKKRILPKIFIGLTSALSIIGVGAALLIKDNYKQAKAVSYDDEEYSITLSADELNNYTFNNFLSLLLESDETFNNIADDFVYNNTSLQYDGGSLSSENYYFTYSYDEGNESYYIDFNYFYENKFAIYTYDDEPSTFLYDIVISGQGFYDTYKNAIEQDIQANQPHDIGQDVISSITSGLGIIGDLAQEFLLGFGALFYANNQLTDFAIFGLVMLGIAISFAIVKLILSIVRSNTGV